MDPRQLAGPLKVAILINYLDEKTSAGILNSLNAPEQEKVRHLLPRIGSIPMDVVDKVAQEFIEKVQQDQSNANFEAAKLKSGRAGSGSRSQPPPNESLAIVRSMDSDQLFQLIQEEHPQTIALILSHLDSSVASEIIKYLGPEMRTDVALRIAKLGKVNPWMLEEIEKYLSQSRKERIPATTQKVGGVGQLADILKRLDGEIADGIMEHIESNDDELADNISQMLFIFDDIVLVDDRGMQQMLRNVETQDLALALKAASNDAKDKIFNNMSSRASTMLNEEMESMGPVRMADVTQAQQKITKLIQEMEKKGELIIKGQGGEELIG